MVCQQFDAFYWTHLLHLLNLAAFAWTVIECPDFLKPWLPISLNLESWAARMYFVEDCVLYALVGSAQPEAAANFFQLPEGQCPRLTSEIVNKWEAPSSALVKSRDRHATSSALFDLLSGLGCVSSLRVCYVECYL